MRQLAGSFFAARGGSSDFRSLPLDILPGFRTMVRNSGFLEGAERDARPVFLIANR